VSPLTIGGVPSTLEIRDDSTLAHVIASFPLILISFMEIPVTLIFPHSPMLGFWCYSFAFCRLLGMILHITDVGLSLCSFHVQVLIMIFYLVHLITFSQCMQLALEFCCMEIKDTSLWNRANFVNTGSNLHRVTLGKLTS
jgi:hypothetical protein